MALLAAAKRRSIWVMPGVCLLIYLGGPSTTRCCKDSVSFSRAWQPRQHTASILRNDSWLLARRPRPMEQGRAAT